MNISNSTEPYIIGETAYNHEGDMKYLLQMIDDISDIGLQAVKFHLLLDIDSYLQKDHPLRPTLQSWLFSKLEWETILDYAHEKKLDIIALCDDIKSIRYIKSKKYISALEIHASGLNDWFLLTEAADFDRTILLGIGGSSIDEIRHAVDLLSSKKQKNVLLMYGFQNYPTSHVEINLSKMKKIRTLFNLPVGYADHTAFDDPYNEIISIGGAMMGFHILEKHYTLDFGKKRIDYHSAVGKEQMLRIKKLMSLALTVHGTGSLGMSQSELEYGNTGPMKKAIVAKKDIQKGEELSMDNLWFKRTEQESYIPQNHFLNILGLKAVRTIKKDEIITFEKVEYTFKKVDFSKIIPGE